MVVELAGNLIIEDGEILLIYREDEKHWEVPGGKVTEDESPTQTAIREAKEEIGVEVELKKPFYSGEFQHNNQIFLWHGYVAEVKNGEPEIEEDKFKELEWFEGSELDELELASNLKMILPSLRKLG
jgi:mutator protein MutT